MCSGFPVSAKSKRRVQAGPEGPRRGVRVWASVSCWPGDTSTDRYSSMKNKTNIVVFFVCLFVFFSWKISESIGINSWQSVFVPLDVEFLKSTQPWFPMLVSVQPELPSGSEKSPAGKKKDSFYLFQMDNIVGYSYKNNSYEYFLIHHLSG